MKTLPEMIKSVRRELSMRCAIYPKRVAAGTMRQDQADHETDCMRSVLDLLERHDQQRQLSMFDEKENQKEKPNSTQS